MSIFIIWGGVWVQLLGGVMGLRSCYSCFTWMYLECACGLTSPPSRYRLPGFSSASGGLSPCLTGSTLGDCLPFPFGEYGVWAKTHHFLLTPTFPCFLFFPLLLTPQCCLLGLLFNNNIYFFLFIHLFMRQIPNPSTAGLSRINTKEREEEENHVRRVKKKHRISYLKSGSWCAYRGWRIE